MDENPYEAPQSLNLASRKRITHCAIAMLVVGITIAGIFWYANDWWAYRSDPISGEPIAMFKFSLFEQAIFSALVGSVGAVFYAGMHRILTSVLRRSAASLKR